MAGNDVFLYAVPSDTAAADVRLRDPTSVAGGGGAIAYTLSGAVGTYAISGQAAQLVVARVLAGAVGTYSQTGNAAQLVTGRRLSGAPGTYSSTGVAATLVVSRRLAGAAGVYLLSGNAASMQVARSLAGAAGVYTINGVAATLTYTPGAGSTAYSLDGAAGTYALSGNAATLVVARALAADAGAYSTAGIDATLTYTPGGGAAAYSLAGDPGAYVLAGGDASFAFSGQTPTGAGGYGGKLNRRKRRAVARALGPVDRVESDVEHLMRLLTEQPQEVPADPEPAKVTAEVVKADPVAAAYIDQLKAQIAQAQAEVERRNQALAALDWQQADADLRARVAAQVAELVRVAMLRQRQAEQALEELDMAYILAFMMGEE